MKRLAIALGTGLLMVTVLVAPALGAAQKIDLVPAAAFPNAPGGGFVVFNSSGGSENLHVTVALKGLSPATAYRIYLFVDSTASGGVDGIGKPLGTVTTNGKGNATFHVNRAVAKGTHDLGIDVVLNSPFTGADLYLSADFYGPDLSATLTFK